MIPLQKRAFRNEGGTKKSLVEFILKTDRFSMGAKCQEFEELFAKKQGSKEAILFNSGGSANLAMLQALKNMGKLTTGDKVGFSSLTWSTNVMPIIQMGFEPVIIDCEIKTLNVMSHNLLATIAKGNIKAFFATNVLGFAGDLDIIKKICDEHNILLLEDNCESLGTELHSGKTGTFGLGASFSFFVAHHMSTIEGGMVCTDNEDFAEMLRIVRANGWDRNLKPNQQKKWRDKNNIQSEFHAKYAFYHLSFNLRPTEITGFLGVHQLQFLDDSIKKREQNYHRLAEFIRNNNDFVPLEENHIKVLSSFAFPIICKDSETRNKYVEIFTDAEIEIRPMIAGNMQYQPFYKEYAQNNVTLPGADFLHNNSFYCGNNPEMTEEELSILENCLRKK